ncbi:MAG: EFR1 family ferrodoxin [Clostridiales bacterium]|jgi:ferredoxin|nr:EFR1 family ferrodoxin [Clostridiales bacterium]
MTVFYFTGTGNSLFAAKKIGGDLVSIPHIIDKPQAYSDDVAGFVFPQYAMGLPKMVRKFVSGNKFNAEYVFAVALYSYIHGGSLPELSGIVSLNYGAYLRTPWNFIWAFGAPKDQTKSLRNTEKPLAAIISDISACKQKPVKQSKSVGSATKYFGGSKFSVSDACVRCGLCVKICPAGNIEMLDKPIFGKNCENCFACVNLCPQAAINSSERMKKHRRYHNPFITPEQIAEANNRNES